ncbi:MAG: hypothetical protein U5N10_07910 [Gemmobacter sp.]|nr:hypothetical protein [Gemmobacter sp.]
MAGPEMHKGRGTSPPLCCGTDPPPPALIRQPNPEDIMKGIFAWVIGIPIPIIILLYLFDVF